MDPYVLVWPGELPSDYTLSEENARCSKPGCTLPGVILDIDYEEPWCQRHADEFTGEEAISGPEIVRVDSGRYKEITERN